ncbi:MAG: type IV pilus assembly protein PilM [Patescibacteria group bacterium]
MSFFTTTETAFGLDISDRNLRLAQMTKKYKSVELGLYNEIRLPPGCIECGEIKQLKIFLDSLLKLMKTKRGFGRLSDEVVAVLPEEQSYLKVMDIPLVEKEQIPEEIKKILPQHVPVSLDSIYFDFQIVKTNENESVQTVLVGAALKKTVDTYVDILSQAGLIPTVLEIEAAAISRVLASQKTDPTPQIIIDIGANRTGLFLFDENVVKFTVSLPISGAKITELIMQALSLDFEKAEQAKIVCGLDREKCHGALLEIFSGTVEELASHINEAIKFYQNGANEPKKIAKIVLGGGGANFINITEIIQGKLGIPTEVSNPWRYIKNPNQNYFDREKSQSFITALGLGLRGINPDTFL